MGLSLHDTERYTSVKQKLLELHDLYEVDADTNVSVRFVLTGHSLGGTIAQELTRELSFIDDTFTYNAGASPIGIPFQGSDPRIHNYVSSYDPIAMSIVHREETVS
eukprot:4121614-Pleurochrysis_carterae.AAC.1